MLYFNNLVWLDQLLFFNFNLEKKIGKQSTTKTNLFIIHNFPLVTSLGIISKPLLRLHLETSCKMIVEISFYGNSPISHFIISSTKSSYIHVANQQISIFMTFWPLELVWQMVFNIKHEFLCKKDDTSNHSKVPFTLELESPSS